MLIIQTQTLTKAAETHNSKLQAPAAIIEMLHQMSY
jgi:hypothetical protein